jgi:DNA-binding transcriptional regulator GbsR (MarR family)
MTYEEGKDKFLQAWGAFGGEWGINRTMAQIHAYLLISPEPRCTQEIMDELQISIGNASMNLRALADWGLVYKQPIRGERKEFFVAEKDMWEVVKKIIVQRKRKELEPVLKLLDDLAAVEGESAEVQEFKKTIVDIRLFSGKADALLETFLRAESDWFVKTFLKMVK